jgi:hypothetical protein
MKSNFNMLNTEMFCILTWVPTVLIFEKGALNVTITFVNIDFLKF